MSEYAHSVMMLLSEKAQLILCFFAAFTVLAWLKAGRSALDWRDSLRRSGAVNLAIVAFNMAALAVPLAATAFLLNLLKDVPHVPAQAWQDAPWLVRAVMALLVFDLANYTMHRLSHASAWLWPMHAVHHSDTDMHFLSANRAHILEWVLLIPTGAIVAHFCGLSISDVAFLGLLREAHQYYVHSNLDWSHGPLRHVLAGPRFHRWHHVDRADAYNKNFALFFPFLDLAFGTYYMPGPAKALPTGFSGNPGDNVLKLLVFPFREWAGLVKALGARRAGTERAGSALRPE
jgi:sterol desaturase/sphingolipid hydroxylase (fatty acid hydroxylase superfamily)